MSFSTEVAEEIRRDEEIDGFHVRLYFLSRNHGLVLGLAIAILALAIGLAWSMRAPDQSGNVPVAPDVALRSELRSATPDARALLSMLVGSAAASEEIRLEITELLGAVPLPADQLAVVQAAWGSLLAFTGEPNADLLILAHRSEPLPQANEFIGDLFAARDQTATAVSYYRREIDVLGTESARRKLVEVLVRAQQHGMLRELSALPAFDPYLSPRLRLSLAVRASDWGGVATALNAIVRETLEPLPVALVIVAAFVWLIVALQAIQPTALISARTGLPLLALLLGLASTWPSQFVSAWQEQVWALRPSGDFLNAFLYYLGGVAPREELIKLLCLAPLLPSLLSRNSRLEMLVVPGCIGLGFAIEGNLQAYAHAGPDGAFGRFLTANFFHFAASGLAGLALCDCLRDPRRGWLPFVGTLVAVIVAHGVYDAFIAVRGVRLLSLVSMLSFLVLSLAFFHALRPLRDEATDQLALSASLLLGLTVLTGATFVCASVQFGFPVAATALATNAIGLTIVTLIFHRQLGRRLAPVVDPSLPTLVAA